MGKAKPLWLRKLKEWTSGVAWAAWLTDGLNQFVRRRTVNIFIVVDIIISGLVSYVFISFKDLALLGWMIHQWWVYGLILLLRVASGIFGIWAVSARKIKLTRHYYAFLMLNMVTTCLVMVPLSRTRCDCVDWGQCQVLFGFSNSTNMFNPYPAPSELSRGDQSIRYQDPPMPLAEAEREWRNLQHSVSFVATQSSLTQLHEKAHNSNNKSGAPKVRRTMSAPGAEGKGHTKHDLKMRENVQARREMAEAKVLESDTHKFYRNQFPGRVESKSLRFFNITKPGISWEAVKNADREQDCVEIPEDDLSVVKDLKKSLEGFETGDTTCTHCRNDLVRRIMGRLNRCARDRECGVVEAHFLPRGQLAANLTQENFTKVTEMGRLTLCSWRYPVEPRVQAKLPDGVTTVFFQKNVKEAGKLLETTSQHQEGKQIMSKVMALNKDEGSELLAENFMDSCRCTRKVGEDTGCQTFFDSASQEYKAWCKVGPTSLHACKSQNIKLFKHSTGNEETDYYWSEDLCRKASCKCSYIGMSTSSPKALPLTRDKRWYGSDCRKWNIDDELPWCYVGWDSTCPDAVKAISEIKIGSHWGDMAPKFMHQFKSNYYCVKSKQQKVAHSSKDYCQTVVGISFFALILLNVASLPMAVVVFKFLIRRCGDHFAVATQFNPYFSSEGDTDDDFEVKASSSSFAKSSSTFAQTTTSAIWQPADNAGDDVAAVEAPGQGRGDKDNSDDNNMRV